MSAPGGCVDGNEIKRAAKKQDQQNSAPTLSPSGPFHPPLPAADSIYTQTAPLRPEPEKTLLRESVVSALPPSIICPSVQQISLPATHGSCRSHQTAVITSASTLGGRTTAGFNAPTISGPIGELPFSCFGEGSGENAGKWTLG